MNKSTATRPFPSLVPEFSEAQQKQQAHPTSAIRWYALALAICILMMATPLARMAGTATQSVRPINTFFLLPGGWMPLNLGFNVPTPYAEMATHVIFFMAFIAVAFVIYLCAARTIWRQRAFFPSRTTLRWIWWTTLVCGLLFALTPAMLSHDIFAYSSYGRMLALYHANPYFDTFASFPHDPFYALDDWKQTPSAYGPIWQWISTLLALLCGDQPTVSLSVYQLLGLALHLLNTFLVVLTLRTLKRSERTVTLGALLYAWNPLVLLESCLNGHNDVMLITFLLLALWSLARIEQQGSTAQKFQFRSYLLPLLMVTFAILIKFSAAPMLILLLILMARKAFLSVPLPSSGRFSRQHWLAALRTICLAGLLSGAIMLLLYVPFWLGRSIPEIIASFTATPAASSAYGSILRALQDWTLFYGQPTSGLGGVLFAVFLNRGTWQAINIFAMGICMILCVGWIWSVPTMRTLALATLAVLGIVLLVTPWFFPWYVTWLVPLAVVALPASEGRLGQALIGSSLVFSVSAFSIYLFMRSVPPIGSWIGPVCLTTILPPLLAFCLLLCFPRIRRQET